jgi:hypothetical protein
MTAFFKREKDGSIQCGLQQKITGRKRTKKNENLSDQFLYSFNSRSNIITITRMVSSLAKLEEHIQKLAAECINIKLTICEITD